MIKYFLLLLLIPLVFCNAQQQDTLKYSGKYHVVIDSIIVNGNKITENDIILKELTVKVGDFISPKIAQYNRDRIFSLGIFTRVDVFPERINDKNILIIHVEESWYIYPIPFVQLKDQDWNKISYGIDLFINNFRGRNELLLVRAAFGYDPHYFLRYYTPYLFRKENISFGAEVSFQNAENKSINARNLFGDDFHQKFIYGQISIGKRFGLYNRAEVNLGYHYVQSPVAIKGISASGKSVDRFPVIGLSYSFDTRDLAQFPRDGIYSTIKFDEKGLGIDKINYQVLQFDFREYRMLFNDLSFKWRFATRQTFGRFIPYYDYSILGYQERIRGHFNQQMEGNSYYVGSLEMNYPLIKDINVSLDFVPLVPKSLLSYRLALYLELFTDTGTTRYRGQSLSLNNFNSGYGAGIIFLILPYNILRVEGALDEYRNLEWLIGLGISF